LNSEKFNWFIDFVYIDGTQNVRQNNHFLVDLTSYDLIEWNHIMRNHMRIFDSTKETYTFEIEFNLPNVKIDSELENQLYIREVVLFWDFVRTEY